MDELKIERYKLEEIKEVLRLTKNIYRQNKQETCFDRMLNKTTVWVNDILKD